MLNKHTSIILVGPLKSQQFVENWQREENTLQTEIHLNTNFPGQFLRFCCWQRRIDWTSKRKQRYGERTERDPGWKILMGFRSWLLLQSAIRNPSTNERPPSTVRTLMMAYGVGSIKSYAELGLIDLAPNRQLQRVYSFGLTKLTSVARKTLHFLPSPP